MCLRWGVTHELRMSKRRCKGVAQPLQVLNSWAEWWADWLEARSDSKERQ
jgi:hypothetical protein